MNKKIAVILFIVIVIGIVVFQNVSARGKDTLKSAAEQMQESAPKPGFLVPAFTLKDLDGKSFEVGGKRDKPMMLNFWASWCDPCEQEAPDLKLIYEKYKADFDLYTVNTTKNDELDEVKKFVKQYDLTFPVLLDLDGKVTKKFRFSFVPTSFLIDRNGVVVDVINILTAKELESRIQKLINS
jgi:thiol-disulfide isomerase/thioredoxin